SEWRCVMTSLRQGWNRRDFLRLGAAAGAGATLGTSSHQPVSGAAGQRALAPTAFNETSIAQLQAAMASRQMSAVELTTFYLNRIQAIDERGPHLNPGLET